MTFNMVAAVAVAVILLAAQEVSAFPQQPTDPVMGILTSPPDDCPPPPPGTNNSQCVYGHYVQWLQSAGIRTVAFPYDANETYRAYLMSSVNGVFLQGGGLSGANRVAYMVYVQRLFDDAVALNQAGDPFVLWGTCQGFQLLSAAAARNVSVIENGFHGMYPLMMPLIMTREQRRSRMLGDATTPHHILKILRTKNSTTNWHHDAVTPHGYLYNPRLASFFKPLSLNKDPTDGRVFISAVEAVNPTFAVYATQFHPERPPYDFSNDKLGHTPDDIAVSNFCARFLAAQLRKNNHSFPRPLDANALDVQNTPRSVGDWGWTCYFPS